MTDPATRTNLPVVDRHAAVSPMTTIFLNWRARQFVHTYYILVEVLPIIPGSKSTEADKAIYIGTEND